MAVESSPLEVTHVDTFERLGRVDGRYPHWVTPYSGERYSVIYYRTVGDTDHMGPAIFDQPEVGAPDPGCQLPVTPVPAETISGEATKATGGSKRQRTGSA